jgi:ABC-2 type transport system permease protein
VTTATRAGLARRQVRLEQFSFWRNPDYAFFTFVLPLMLLGLLGAMNSGDGVHGRTDIKAITFVVPGVLAFSLIATAYGNLATRLAVLRCDSVLKRIRTTPLAPATYLLGHLGSTLVTASLAALATILLGMVAFGVAPVPSHLPELGLALFLGIICFAGLGLAVSSVIPHADAAGPITNATYLPLAIVSGLFDPTISLPQWLVTIVSLLPIRALYELLTSAYDPAASGLPPKALTVMTVWAVGAVVLAVKTFRWTPRRT